MAIDRLPNLPRGADVFLDANIFIYAFAAQSTDCRDLLRRCAREEVYGITTLEVINEVTHRLMLSEAVARRRVGVGSWPLLFKGRKSGREPCCQHCQDEGRQSRFLSLQGMQQDDHADLTAGGRCSATWVA